MQKLIMTERKEEKMLINLYKAIKKLKKKLN